MRCSFSLCLHKRSELIAWPDQLRVDRTPKTPCQEGLEPLNIRTSMVSQLSVQKALKWLNVPVSCIFRTSMFSVSILFAFNPNKEPEALSLST